MDKQVQKRGPEAEIPMTHLHFRGNVPFLDEKHPG
jgi:hypothetical protein